MSEARQRAGFTLIEMLAVVFFTTIVLVVAVNFFIDLNRASEAAIERSRSARRAVAVADRVARDLEGTVLLVKPDDVDPLEHPWMFVAESGAGAGADRLKFVRRGRRPRSTEVHESDLEVVAYFYRQSEAGGEIYRASWPRLPEGLDRSFPGADDEGVALLADEIAIFDVRLLGEDGAWAAAWDSTTLANSGQLPLAIEISVAAWEPVLEEFDPPEPTPVVRTVRLPVRPIDLAALLEEQIEAADEEEEEEESDCVTVEQCRDLNPEPFQLAVERNPFVGDLLENSDFLGQCFEDHASTLEIQVEGCE